MNNPHKPTAHSRALSHEEIGSGEAQDATVGHMASHVGKVADGEVHNPCLPRVIVKMAI